MSIVLRAWPRIEEFWFDEAIPPRGVDVAWLHQRPAIPEIAQPSAKYTLVVDLTLTNEQLLANMQSETRYEIRRAQNKDALEFRAPTAPDASSLVAFHDLFARFAAEKGLSPVSMEYLQAAAKAGVLRLGSMMHEGEVVVWHSYLLIGSRVRLLHSASLFRGQASARRSLIGRANRLLHWLEMQHFRDAGFTLYDFGGWYAGQNHEDFLRVNRFKEGFGGTVRQEAEGVRGLTLLGRAYLWARQTLLGRAYRWARRRGRHRLPKKRTKMITNVEQQVGQSQSFMMGGAIRTTQRSWNATSSTRADLVPGTRARRHPDRGP